MRIPKRRLTRKLSIIAQDPAVRLNGRILRAEVDVPAERVLAGPNGYRIQVIDRNKDGTITYPACRIPVNHDAFLNCSDERLVDDPRFHAQNVYAILMRTLARFEQALGRRISWGFPGHQLVVMPHAMAEPNAFYSPQEGRILFGYFPGHEGTVYTALSHDVIAHEGTHALVHGLRRLYLEPSSPDQAAFHEGFADIVALLSVLALQPVVASVLGEPELQPRELTTDNMKRFLLFGLAKQMGEELSQLRGQPLRRSIELKPGRGLLVDSLDPHGRGEVLVAAVMNSFLEVWVRRLRELGTLDRQRIATEGADTADRLLTICIRALDFAPPTDIVFSDFLSAVLTADHEINPDDSRFRFRRTLLATFSRYGIRPSSKGLGGMWEPPEGKLRYDRTHLDSLQRDPEEVFRFLWENRKALLVLEGADTFVQSVRPAMRVASDGFIVRETVAEYVQRISMPARELNRFRIRVPDGMPPNHNVTLWGGGALIFDEFAALKFHVRNRIDNSRRQTARLEHLWKLRTDIDFADMHRRRAA